MRIMDRGLRACGEGTPPIYSSSIQEVGLYARTLDINLTADQSIGHAYAKLQSWKYADAWAALEETQQGVVETSYNQDPSVISQPRDRDSGVSRGSDLLREPPGRFHCPLFTKPWRRAPHPRFSLGWLAEIV